MMKKILILTLFIGTFLCASGQYSVEYYPSLQSKSNMQYWKPKGKLNVGDCMPFYHDGNYYLYWLVDSLHGNNLNGLGGHQWVLSTTKDLKHWQQDSIVVGIDKEWEKSICTGSMVYYNHKYYAFYATRLINQAGNVNEQLSYAVSNDGIHFTKQQPNPFYTSAPGYSKRNFRDPKVFVDSSGEFHLFVASEQDSSAMSGALGCLVHLSSRDLKHWTVHQPVLTGQGSVPECPDYFYWKGWYYLVYSDNSNTHYVMSRNKYGPWQQPRYQALNEDWANVVKTAGFHDDRRIAAAWIPARWKDEDNGHEIFGGNMVFREIIQEPDGTLDTRFPPEMVPQTEAPLAAILKTDLLSKKTNSNSCTIDAPDGVGAAHFDNIPQDCKITMEISPVGANEEYGLYLRSNAQAKGGYRLNFSANQQIVSLGNTDIKSVEGLNNDIKVEIIMTGDIIDVSINGKRCVANRTPEQHGDFLWLYSKHGKVKFNAITINPLKK